MINKQTRQQTEFKRLARMNHIIRQKRYARLGSHTWFWNDQDGMRHTVNCLQVWPTITAKQASVMRNRLEQEFEE